MATPQPSTDPLVAIDDLLRKHEQTHLLRFWSDLNEAEQSRLVDQIEAIDFEQVSVLSQAKKTSQVLQELASKAGPPQAIRKGDNTNKQQVDQLAEDALSMGKVGVVLVAGGQGTRLGFPHPKGMLEIGPISKRTLFQFHIDQLKAISKRYRCEIPIYVMTSPATHEETVKYFEEADHFGISTDNLHLFCQGTMPAVDAKTGRVLMSEVGEISLSPDGHGGMLEAFQKSGCFDHAKNRGIEQIFYFQVDNPLVAICDVDLLGRHLLEESELTTQVVAKKNPEDRVGNVVEVDGTTMVIEYSDLPLEVANQRNADGSLKLWAGNIAVHVFDLQFLERMTTELNALPFHVAKKKVRYVDADGNSIDPVEPNAIKFERFIFDLLPLAKNAIVVETDEKRRFAPVKNASSASSDTPETARAAIVRESRLIIESAGGIVDPDVIVEINPLFALDSDEFISKIEGPIHITAPTYFSPEGRT